MDERTPPSEPRPSWRRFSLNHWTDEAAGMIVSTSLAALGILLADRLWRPDWDFSWTDHWISAPILYLAPAALMGLLWANVRLVQERMSRRFRGNPPRRDYIRAAIVALIAAVGSHPAAGMTFSGAKVSSTWLGAAGPPIFVSGVFGAIFLCTLLLWRAQRRVAWGRYRLAVTVALSFLAAGGAALWVDMNVYVGLYEHLHAFLEFGAFAFFVGANLLLGFMLVRWLPALLVVTRASAVGLVVLGVLFVAYKPLRTWTDSHLAHAWVDEYYVGRALRRTQLMELQLTGGDSLRVARVDHLARRFDLKKRQLAPEYLEMVDLEPPPSPIRNILFYYVDTLRADVAANEALMPHLAAFRRESLDFRRAYASGSDTLRSLPTIVRGNYFIGKTHPGHLLRLAEESGHHTRLVIAQSAADFLKKLLPSFKFQQIDTVPDYEEGERVWGYGAHRSTAAGVGDRALEFLKSRQAKEPFLLWLFHFDAHAWRELDDTYIKETRERLDVAEKGRLNVRYRVIARSVDEQLARVLQGLKSAGRDKDTAVVFLSDHGEGLGQGGFWVHSIFLWESLVHVPLAMRLPGVAPAQVNTPVSIVDVAPTLAVSLGATRAVYHGENLTHVAAGAERRLPVLLRAGQFHGHDRIGVVDAHTKRKLVVRLEAAFPELIAYETDGLDAHNLAPDEEATVRRLMRMMAQSPVFPRSDDDFELHAKPKELAVAP